ncbi:unnamed protein product, partial [Brenthis ino]
MYDKSFIFIFITISSLVVYSTEQWNCEVQSSLPPDPATGCCGQDISGIQRVEDSNLLTELVERLNDNILTCYKGQAPYALKSTQRMTRWRHQNLQALLKLFDLQDLLTRNNYRRSSNKSASFEDGIIPSRRIAGGTETEFKQFPWIVYIETLFNPADGWRQLACGGSLISTRYVLTAAHCIHNDTVTMNTTRVTLAQYNLKTFPKDCKFVMGEEQCVENILIYAEEAIYHPNYYRDYLYHDIALLRLREHAPYTDFIRPICLPTFDIDQPEFANLPLQIAGWGKTDPQGIGPVSIVKRQAVVNLIPNNECRNIYSSIDAFPVIRSQLCTVARNGQDFCEGDSGGPLMLLYKEQSNCAAQWVPPDPATECCGKDLSGVYRVEDLQNLLPRNNLNRHKHSTNDSALFESENISRRITGGTDTELDQFPWVVYIETYFEQILRTCTGALISDLYILTAAHCVHEYGLNLVGIQVSLAEYDLKYFPIDCKYVMGENQQCVENILMYAVDSGYHSQHDGGHLSYDIGIIKLRSYAPYTRFIRPICLPPFDVDRPDFANLPLQVAGWGKINPYDNGYGLKLSTVVNLVPHDECRNFYNDFLLRSQLCAVGRAGQDPCPGDSGGPLMLLYREQSNCEVQSSLPPDPATGCCGQDISGIQRVEGL